MKFLLGMLALSGIFMGQTPQFDVCRTCDFSLNVPGEDSAMTQFLDDCDEAYVTEVLEPMAEEEEAARAQEFYDWWYAQHRLKLENEFKEDLREAGFDDGKIAEVLKVCDEILERE